MDAVAQQRRLPVGLFADKPAPRLYDRIVPVLRLRHDSRRTEEACVHGIRRYIEFHQHRHPRQLAEGDGNRFLTHLAVKEHVAASTRNQALSAILFLYEHGLEQPLDRTDKRLLLVHQGTTTVRLDNILNLDVDYDRSLLIVTKDGTHSPVIVTTPDALKAGAIVAAEVGL